MNTTSQKPLTVSQAFRRFFQLIAAGFLLPTSIAVGDPCERNRRIHQSLTYEQMVSGLLILRIKTRTEAIKDRALIFGETSRREDI